MSVTIIKKISFDAAHFLPGHPGKCKATHGHHWVVEIGVVGKIDPDTGLVIDFSDLKSFLTDEVFEKYDHKLLNDFIDNPTAEKIAKRVEALWISWSTDTHLKEDLSGTTLSLIRVWETETSYIELRP